MALTPEEEKELKELEAIEDKPKTSGLTPEEEEELAGLEAQSSPDKVPAKEKPKSSIIQSILAAESQVPTFGFGDELAAVGTAALEAQPEYDKLNRLYAEYGLGIKGAKDLPAKVPPSSFGEGIRELLGTYRESRDVNRDRLKESYEAHPAVSNITSLGGSLLLPGLGKLAQTKTGIASLGGLFGLGLSEADLTKGEVGQSALDTSIGAALAGLTAGATKYVTGKVGGALAKRKTSNIEKKIAEQVTKLKKTQAIPEAEILEQMAQGPGTKTGMAAREQALMSPLTREARIKTFLHKTRDVADKITDNKRNFDSSLRMDEARKNLTKVPAQQTRGHINELTVKIGALSDEIADNPDLYDAPVGKKVNRILNQMREDLYNPSKKQSSFDMYDALNSAKQKIQSYGKYDSSRIGPVEQDTIDLVRKMEGFATEALEDPRIFGKQAVRHKEVNEAYTRYLSSLDNLEQKMLQQEYVPHGRPQDVFSSTKMGTYAKQIDTAGGEDRIRFFDTFLDEAENFSKVIEKTPLKSRAGKVASEVSGFKKNVRDPFVTDMTLSNQLRRLRWDQGVQNAAAGGAGPIPGMAVRGAASASRIPGAKMVADMLTKNVDEMSNAQKMIRELLDKETQMQAGGNFITGAGRAIKQATGRGIQKLGGLAPGVGMEEVQRHFMNQMETERTDEELRQKTGLGSIQGATIQDPQERIIFSDQVNDDPELTEQEKMRIGTTGKITGRIIHPRQLAE